MNRMMIMAIAERRKMVSKYLELYPESLSGHGLFTDLSRFTSVPWSVIGDSEISALEVAYGLHSGNKDILPSFSKVNETKRANVIASFYERKWHRLWDDYMTEYSPLDPYHISETGSHTRNIEETDSTEYGHKVEEVGTDTGTVGNQGTDNSSTNRNLYGFNSTEPVPAETGSTNSSNTSSETRDLSASRDTTHSGIDSKSANEEETYNYNSNKSGNIGYFTPQDLLKKDIELWKATYFSIVFSDIDDLIMNKLYSM